jgi:3-oxoacyl-[acyl-carrier-protein] synthase-3
MQKMMHPFRSVIAGCGAYVPARVVTNDDLAQIVDTSHEWIVERTGIHQRHFAEEGELTSDLAVKAAREALDMAGLRAADIDLIIVATTTPDLTFPSTGTIVQHKLGSHRGFAFDVAAVCSGYLLAQNIADLYLKTGQVKSALVIGAETLSRLLDMGDRRSCVLFGDGAGAIVLKAEASDQTDRGILGTHLQSDGAYRDILYMDGGIASTGTCGKIRLSGQEVFKHAVLKLAQAAEDMLTHYQLRAEQLDWLIPHQANLRIIEAIAKRLNISMDKVITTVQKHGNTSAASIPLALNDAVRSGKIKPGQYILHEAIGSGLIWGAALLKY